MRGGGAFLIVIVGLLLLAGVLYGKTGCFGGFWSCMFAGNGGGPTVHGTVTTGIIGQPQTFKPCQLAGTC